MSINTSINNYRQAGSAEASYATPHRLVQMLMTGALDGIAKAKGCIEHDQHEDRHRNINWTISLIEALRGALNFEEGGDIASNLDMLYDYMIRRLYDANVQNDVESLQEVGSLLKEIKKAWEAMPELIKRAENIQDAVGST